MMVVSMLIFGGPTLHYFALALTIGILFGIYSSVFVAAAIVMWLRVKREDLVKAAAKGGDPNDPNAGAVDPERRSPGVESLCNNRAPHQQHPWRPSARAAGLAYQARRVYTEELVKGLPRSGQRGGLLGRRARAGQATPGADPVTADAAARPGGRPQAQRRHLAPGHGRARCSMRCTTRVGASAAGGDAGHTTRKLSLVDDETIEREITHVAPGAGDDGPRRHRVQRPARPRRPARAARGTRPERPPAPPRAGALRHRRLGPRPAARFRRCAMLQAVLHEEFAVLVQEAYHEANSLLVQRTT